ncbi:MAG: hypothetical protein IJO28_06800 [Oscillospiraceae bacterium]|nr:hypothetical protein [Oscillospiraceae bacterium]
MKVTKAIGALFILIGLSFAIFGIAKYISILTEKDERIYTTAKIVRIEDQETGDPEFPLDHTTYVELEVNGERITTKLNTYKSSFKIGDQIDIYYFANDTYIVYEDGSDIFYMIVSLFGVVFAAMGTIFVFRKNK